MTDATAKPPTAPPPPTSPPPANARQQMSLAKAEAPKFANLTPKFRPPRLVLNGVEGWGKTSVAAFAPDPAIIMIRGETGYETLLGAGIVPNVPAMRVGKWQEFLAVLDELIALDDIPYKTLAIDALGGLEHLCHEYVTARDYKGEGGVKGFQSYQQGPKVAVTDWAMMLQKLDAIHDRGVIILILSHCGTGKSNDAMNPEYTRFMANINQHSWGPTNAWADAVLFATYYTMVEKPKQGKAIGLGGTDRVIYTRRHATYDAKNRYSMPDHIDIPEDVTKVWGLIWDAMTANITQA